MDAASSFGQPTPGAGQDESGSGEAVVLADDEVRGEIAGRPRLEEGWRLGTELVEQVAEPRSLDGVEGPIGHAPERRGAAVTYSPASSSAS
jgi:hypothetical protein